MNNDAIQLEVDAILEDAIFQRSPIQSRLLAYLCKRTCAAQPTKISQFDIATEGLGKADYDESGDSYVRVQISRLKRSLTSYYSRRSPERGGWIYLKQGDYRLRIGSRAVAYPALTALSSIKRSTTPAARQPTAGRAPARRPAKREKGHGFLPSLSRKGVFGAGAVFAFGSMLLVATFEKEPKTVGGAAIAPPAVSYEVETEGFGANDARLASLQRAVEAELGDQISKSLVAVPYVPSFGSAPQFDIKVRLDRDVSDGWRANIQLVDASGRAVHHASRALPADEQRAFEILRQELVAVSSPPGAISRALARNIEGRPRSDFECFVTVELGRYDGMPMPDLLAECAKAYPDSAYSPYIAAREIYLAFQQEALESDTLRANSPHWKRLGELLEKHPENPYLNTVAAKALYGAGRCREADRYADTALIRGRTFPALELSLLVEQLGCGFDEAKRARAEARVVDIVEANPRPHAFLEVWAIACLLIIDRPDLIDRLASEPFETEGALDSAATHLRQAAAGKEAPVVPRLVRTVVWNPEARRGLDRELQQLAAGGADASGAAPTRSASLR